MGSNHLIEWSRRDLESLVREALSYKSTSDLIRYIRARGDREGRRAVLIDREIIRLDQLSERRRDAVAKQNAILLIDAARLRHHSQDSHFFQSIFDQAVSLTDGDPVLLKVLYEDYCREVITDTYIRIESVRDCMASGETVLSGEIEKLIKDIAQVIYFTETWSGAQPSETLIRRLINDALIIDLCGCPGALRERLHELGIQRADRLLDILEFD